MHNAHSLWMVSALFIQYKPTSAGLSGTPGLRPTASGQVHEKSISAWVASPGILHNLNLNSVGTTRVFHWAEHYENESSWCALQYSEYVLCSYIVLSVITGSANERRRYNVTSSLIGWAHAQNEPYFQESARIPYKKANLPSTTKANVCLPSKPHWAQFLDLAITRHLHCYAINLTVHPLCCVQMVTIFSNNI